MPNVKAAAERLANWKVAKHVEIVSISPPVMQQFIEVGKASLDHLAENPADGEEEATMQWLLTTELPIHENGNAFWCCGVLIWCAGGDSTPDSKREAYVPVGLGSKGMKRREVRELTRILSGRTLKEGVSLTEQRGGGQ